ncbi:DHA1 family inner membrane transport protein [Bradyrhizobium japonicum]|uniref:MFS transporter n=1 Tax=Bradyrhizobium diazoefficiens TaxID=1355477 RepID=A0A809XTM4_9BRAD|nr:MFS transporter [Bradyrhizobium diazoefficiens]MBP1065017.1 DHA1 family inner membrane transport protein [Bradyrhizobium japonicum]BCA04718.1 MFS transporter [Bradyrhizobium diazoefficiens]BCA22073.1 MFS transporter [Bradyrhizobium diazoefficiens]BCE31392.1 MFS transporter [Bradyrhizobium diazoefficiens]BCE40235.1 MFS transporter [Bradyrhizobium diazoefficiens]
MSISPQATSPHATAASAPPHLAIVLFSLAMGGFAIGTTEFASMSLLPFFAADLRVDEPTAGHAISAYALGVVLGAPLIAVLGARFARRTQLLVLMAVFALGNALTALAPGFGWMIAARFLAGLPHGAYFGIAALVAASLVPQHRRSRAIGQVMLGLTGATIIGVPLANLVGQTVGWRASFGLVSLLALLTVLLCALFAPRDRAGRSDPLRELGALRSGRVWITLAIGAIGFGGMFAVYTYLATTLIEVTKVSPAVIPFFLAVFGVGATLGNLFVPRFADRALMPTAGVILLFSAVALLVFPLAAGNPWLLAIDIFAIGAGVSLGAILQTRLMDVAGDAQALAAALNHSAFNTANALGPFLGGLAIREGLGWTSTGPVGAALALLGFLIWIVASRDAGSAPVQITSELDAAPLKNAAARPSPPLAPDDQSRSASHRDPVA